MAAAILSFPTLLERDDVEFTRSGASNYTRAVDEAAALWAAMSGPPSADRAGLAQRLAAFGAQIAYLARYRPECLEDLVVLAGDYRIELGSMPAVLKAAMAPRAAND